MSIRAVIRNYLAASGAGEDEKLTPKDIYDIASGVIEGNMEAAISAFEAMGRHLGDVIANLISIMDGLVVMGGGIAGADKFFMPAIMKELERQFDFRKHDPIPRLIQRAFNLNEKAGINGLTEVTGKFIDLPGTDEKIYYDQQPKVGIGTSRIGASRAISLGAYAYALSKLNV